MNSPHLIRFVGFGVVIVGSLSLSLAPFFGRSWKFPSWIRVACWMLGPIGVGWGTLGFLIYWPQQHFSSYAHWVMTHAKSFLAGAGVGILLLCFLSGEFTKSIRRDHTKT